MTLHSIEDATHRVRQFSETFETIRNEINKVIVGQADVVDGVLTALMVGGHVLIEGVPGLGKTMLVSTLSQVVNLQFNRIQFTPDMMPADIVGSSVLVDDGSGNHTLTFQEGPIVANLVLADEINRATPKTQSALLEVMQEKQLTAGHRTITMPDPFCVMATQNPVDQEGTYALPEAQLDRFLFKLIVGYPSESDYHTIIDRTTSNTKIDVQAISSAKALCELRQTVRDIPVPNAAKTFAIRLVMASQPGSEYATDMVNQYVALGASPRGIQSLMLAAKVRALLARRFAVSCDDVEKVALPVLRHRVACNFKAQAAGISADAIIEDIQARLPRPDSKRQSP
ncbi:AAA family ATPase [Alteromonas gilva]|uniref:MoxR family ATPase n=1 Tax=Alteromonas gilva TaxID=2987522 RepID=A0ABT5L186_9ALTE|nr:MoxR family ATPase [Alteromonas gilva]MDC8830231.1 MoxR family ATPase [Alteromonas gilva]